MMEKLIEQEAMMVQEDQKVQRSVCVCVCVCVCELNLKPKSNVIVRKNYS